MRTIGYVRVSTDRQADQGVSLEAQEAKIRAMATVQSADLIDVIADGGESAKSLNRPGLQRLLSLVTEGTVQAVIVAKLAGSPAARRISAGCSNYLRNAKSHRFPSPTHWTRARLPEDS